MTSALPPDPAKGIFETMLVLGGRPVELDAHLDRLAASLVEAYAAELPSAARADALEAARGTELGRLRLDVRPTAGGELHHQVAASEVDPSLHFPPWERAAAMRSIAAPEWSGAHKWADRAWLEAIEASLGAETPLLLGADGSVLEGARSNVFAVRDGTLLTPPADGRILPGTARAATLELARQLGIPAQERRLTLEDLFATDGAFLTGSVRGIGPIASIDGDSLPPPTALVAALAEALRGRWLADSRR